MGCGAGVIPSYMGLAAVLAEALVAKLAVDADAFAPAVPAVVLLASVNADAAAATPRAVFALLLVHADAAATATAPFWYVGLAQKRIAQISMASTFLTLALFGGAPPPHIITCPLPSNANAVTALI